MAAVLPLTFSQSFSSDKGLTVLHSKVHALLQENEHLLLYIRSNTAAYRALAQDLLGSLPAQSERGGFNVDEGSSLKRAVFSGLLAGTQRQGLLYRKTAMDLESSIVEPFSKWTDDHASAMTEAKETIATHIQAFAKAYQEVTKTKGVYDAKCVEVEELEDETKFHAQEETKPAIAPLAIPQTSTMQGQKKSPGALMSPSEDDDSTPTDTKFSSVGIGQPEQASHISRRVSLADRLKTLTKDLPVSPSLGSISEAEPASLSQRLDDDPSILEIAGIKNAPSAWSSIFKQANKEMPKRSLKIPLIGTYEDVHTGEDLVAWFREHMIALDGDYLKAYEFCRQLSEEILILRLIGEIGHRFSDANDTYYQFRPEAYQLDTLNAPKKLEKDEVEPLPDLSKSPLLSNQALLKRSGTIISSIQSAFTPTPASVKLQKMRLEVEEAKDAYKIAVRRAELLRMKRDEQVENYLNFLQQSQYNRLVFLKQTLVRYQAYIAPLRPVFLSQKKPTEKGKEKEVEQPQDELAFLIESIKPDSDIQALCELYRVQAGYRSKPVVFQDHYSESWDALFGGELLKWQEVQLHHGMKLEDTAVPPVFSTMLQYLTDGYSTVEMASDKRRIWYLEVPLMTSHRLRQALNDTRAAQPGQDVPVNFLKQSDIAVIASCVKLFLLDLEQPLVPFALYEDLRKMYHTLGASASTSEEGDSDKLESLKDLLQKVPHVHLLVMDALVSHIKTLMENTRSTEDNKIDADDVYLSKVSTGLGRCIARPREDNAVNLSDKASSYLFIDLVKHRNEVLPDSIAARGKREKERFQQPQRKRTRPVDVRLSRSKLGSEQISPDQAQAILEEQMHQRDAKPLPALQAEPESIHTPMDKAREELPTLQPNEPSLSGTVTPDPPFQTPQEESEDKLASAGSIVEAAPTVIPLPAAFNVAGHSTEVDPPFTAPEDPPFSPPIDESTEGLTRKVSNGLSRTPRVLRGPRKIDEVPTGRVAAAAQRFSGLK